MDKEQVRKIVEQYGEHTFTKEFFQEVKKYYDTIEIVYDEYPSIYYVSELNKTIYVGL